jgi:hypothetical protein
VDANKITYPDIFPGMDLQYEYCPGGLHQNLIIKRREALPSLPEGMSPNSSYLVLESKLSLPGQETAGLRGLIP